MTDLKPLTMSAIPAALERAEHYRALNEPSGAESICRDVLRADSEHQRALVLLVLSLTDQFARGVPVTEPCALIKRLNTDYERVYYEGIINERQGKAQLRRGTPGSAANAHDWLRKAMTSYERAEVIRPTGNDDAILRWNACARVLRNHQLGPRSRDAVEHPIE